MLDELQKTALITGSSIRIGKYVTESLAMKGWKIALHYHTSEKEAYHLAKKLLPFTDVIIFQADLADANQSKHLIDQINKQLGPVNLVINNASIYKNDNLFNLTQDLLEKNLNIHLNSPIYLAQAMIKQEIEGNIINILDTDITKNMKNFFSYSLSKKSLYHLTKMLAFNLAPSIRVNAIALGATLFKEGQNQNVFDQHIKDSPLQKSPKLVEVYQTVEFLLNASSITGQCIFLDGGRHLI